MECVIQNQFAQMEAKISSNQKEMNDLQMKRLQNATSPQGIELLTNRQKLVKLADMSDNGWRVVQEYQLASDSDDEKRVIKDEARAAKKVKEEKAKKQKGNRFNPYRGGRDTAAAQAIPTVTNAVPRGSKRPGNCFRCGEARHWQRECGNTMIKLSSCTICNFILFVIVMRIWSIL